MDTDNHSTPEASVSTDPVDDIARLLMGDSDESGEEAQAAPTQEQTTETPDTEDDDDAEELSEESTEGDEVDESEEESEETEDGDQTLAEMLGLDETQITVMDDGNFMINVKVDGELSKHSLADVVKNYQTESSVTNKSKALADERKNFESAVATKALEIKDTLERNQRLTQVLEQEILAEYEAVDWDDLRKYDPAEWSAKRQEYASKYQKIQRLQNELGTQATEEQEHTQQEMTEKQQVYLKGQWEQMLQNNPTWNDTTAFDTDMGAMRKFAADTYGFTDKDFSQVSDARLIELIKDAQSYRKGKTVATKKLKKPVPKIQKRGKGGKFVKTKVSKLDKLTRAAKTAKGSQKRGLQVDAVAELLMTG